MFDKPQSRWGTLTRGSGDCSAGSSGWVNPGMADSANGNRATFMEACLTQDFLDQNEGSDTDVRKVAPPGYRWAGRTARHHGLTPRENINACHLLAKELSGDGKDLRNLSTCARGANAAQTGSTQGVNHMYTYEAQVKKAVAAGQTVYYRVTPDYKGNRTVAWQYRIQASGTNPDGSAGISISAQAPNELINGRNLGMSVDPTTKQPVPLAGMN
ncbi:DNA/RNA non-specific endonuclease [Streptomyces sp. NPDC005395]|uniref:DNA/RNA non-specific endonuclease n=1 Tax=Streptomyces sp. NPDC005395 TaxID=3157042 RepID=UPI0033B2E6B2